MKLKWTLYLTLKVTLNGSLATPHHSVEIDQLFYELRKCLIEVPNLTSMSKAFLLMSLDLYHNGFKSVGKNLEKFYSKFLDEHDSTGNRGQHPPTEQKKDFQSDDPTNSSYSLRNLKKDFAGLKTNGKQDEHRRINREYLNRPIKASDRLKYFQNSNSELSRDVRRTDDMQKSPRSQAIKSSSSEICLSKTNSLNNNQLEGKEISANHPALLTIPTNCQDPATTTITTKDETVASPTESYEFVQQNIQPKLENFNWFEAVEREEIPDFTPNLNNSSGSNKFDTLSVASYGSNPASPQECVSPKPSHTNRSRRNSLNRFRSEYYRQSNEDLHQQNEKRAHRNDSKQNYHQSWRNASGNSTRNDSRNGYNKRGDYERENSNNNGRHNDGGNYNRRNLTRGGSVDSKSTDFGQQRTRHDSFNRRNQENDNFEHFQSYNRKSYSRNKDNFMNNRTLPPRLQQKWQQQQQRADYNNECDNPKRFNSRNNQSSAGNNSKGNGIFVYKINILNEFC